MTGIMIGFSRARHRLGTVYGNGTLTSADTGINAAGPNGGGSGDSTINLPLLPSALQAITINNGGTGTVTVSGNGNNIGSSATTTIATSTSKWFIWDGYTWGFVTWGSCETVTLPATKDFGTTSQGPAETAYSVPSNTVEYVTIGVDPCGNSIRRIITTTYSGRLVDGQYKVTAAFTSSSGYYPWVTQLVALGVVVGYGATFIDANTSISSQFASAGMPMELTYDEITYSTIGRVVTAQPGYLTPSPFVPENNSYWSNGTVLTLYYLDTHIVWTYEII